MKTKHPAWRFILALKANRQDPDMFGLPDCGGCELWNQATERMSEVIRGIEDDGHLDILLSGKDGDVYRAMYDAWRIFNLTSFRLNLETFLLSGIGVEEALSIFNLKRDVYDAYVLIFFDVSVFASDIDRHEYVAGIKRKTERSHKEVWEKDVNYLKWYMGMRVETDTNAVLTSLLSEVYYRFTSCRDSKEAVKLADLAVKTANKLMDTVDSDKFMEDIRLALEYKAPDFKPFKE